MRKSQSPTSRSPNGAPARLASTAAVVSLALLSVACARQGGGESQFRATDGTKASLLWYWGLEVKEQEGMSGPARAALAHADNKTKVFSCWYRTDVPLQNFQAIRSALEADRDVTAAQISQAFFSSGVVHKPLSRNYVDCAAFAAAAGAKAREIDPKDTRDFSGICKTGYARNGGLATTTPTASPVIAVTPQGATVIALDGGGEPQANLIDLGRVLQGAVGVGCITRAFGMSCGADDDASLQSGARLITASVTSNPSTRSALEGASASVIGARDPSTGRIDLGELALGLAGSKPVVSEISRRVFSPGSDATPLERQKAANRATSATGLFSSLFSGNDEVPVNLSIGQTQIEGALPSIFGDRFRSRARGVSTRRDGIRDSAEPSSAPGTGGTGTTAAPASASGAPARGNMDEAHPKVTMGQFDAIAKVVVEVGSKPLGFLTMDEIAKGVGACPDLK